MPEKRVDNDVVSGWGGAHDWPMVRLPKAIYFKENVVNLLSSMQADRDRAYTYSGEIPMLVARASIT